MGKKPLLAQDIYQKYVDDNGDISWPTDIQERKLLARAIYGKWLIGKFDSWLNTTLDYLEHPEPSTPFLRKNSAYRQDKYFRDGLSALSLEQKAIVQHLVRTAGTGILFSSLVFLDQCPYGEYLLALKLNGKDDGTQMVQLAPDKNFDLHDELNDWIISFSQFAGEIVELVETQYGWQFQPKDFS